MVMDDMIRRVVMAAPGIVTAIIIFIIFWFLAKFTNAAIHRIAEKSALQRKPVFIVLATFSNVAILMVGAITALGSGGVDVSGLVASVGLSGLALSIASKDAFANLLGGIMVLLYQPFEIGSEIQVGENKGQVIRMTLRYTHLRSQDKEILIPNSTLLTNHIVIHKQ
jgi:small conductance mechanosensitive channel